MPAAADAPLCPLGSTPRCSDLAFPLLHTPGPARSPGPQDWHDRLSRKPLLGLARAPGDSGCCQSVLCSPGGVLDRDEHCLMFFMIQWKHPLRNKLCVYALTSPGKALHLARSLQDKPDCSQRGQAAFRASGREGSNCFSYWQ